MCNRKIFIVSRGVVLSLVEELCLSLGLLCCVHVVV